MEKGGKVVDPCQKELSAYGYVKVDPVLGLDIDLSFCHPCYVVHLFA